MIHHLIDVKGFFACVQLLFKNGKILFSRSRLLLLDLKKLEINQQFCSGNLCLNDDIPASAAAIVSFCVLLQIATDRIRG
jgi:hypothetical protein